MQAEDLKSRILKKKKKLNAVIMAHYYQVPEIQEIADFVGDSLALARQAARTDAEVIVACGVMFMAETAKILNPDKIVLIPDPEAGCLCSYAQLCTTGWFVQSGQMEGWRCLE